MRRSLHLILWAQLLCLPLIGCGFGGPKLVPVSGRVMLDGKPLAHATVSFQPLAKGHTTDSIATTDDEGRYTLQALVGSDSPPGAVPGKHMVRISLFDRTAMTTKNGRTMTGLQKVPAKYNNKTTLDFTVPEEGTDKADFLNLTSK